MSFELFKDELEMVSSAQALLDEGAFADPAAAAHYAALLKGYQKLLKNLQRLIRLSDRNEEKQNAMARALDEKNKMLENLSGKLARYLSPQVYNSIFSGEKDVVLSTERKKLTVFFSDLQNFTLTTEDMQPEDLTAPLNSYFTEMSRIALEHGATIDKFIGDAMLMFFGDPETKGVQEDARACVRMAIAMQRRMAALEREWHAMGYEKAFKMRIGINTGYCNVGNFGSDDRMDYTIIGGEVNLAARLEAKADPGGILMAYETYALTQDIVRAEEREPLQVKGIRREVRPFAVVGILDEEAAPQVLKAQGDGFALSIDPAKVQGARRAQSIAELAGLVQALRGLQARE